MFFPIGVIHAVLPVLLDASTALGIGQAPELQEAWSLLKEKGTNKAEYCLKEL
jgi:hypothetical protein